MANHFPVMDQMQLAMVQYSVQVAGVSGPMANFPAGSLDLVSRNFATVQPDATLGFDYSGFDQDAYETQLHGLLNQLCSVMAGNVGVSVPQVQAVLSVNRKWVFSAPVQMLGSSYSQCEIDDLMPYP